MKPVLIFKFPYASRYGGGEHHTLLLVEELLRRGAPCFLCASCSVLLSEFRRRNWSAHRWWAGKEPVSWWSALLFPFSAPFVLFGLVVVTGYYRFSKNVRTVYCHSLTEKLLLTPFARLLGMRVIWAEHVEILRWLSLNPYRFLYRWWSRLVTIVAISQVIKKQLTDIGVPEDRVRVIYTGVDLRPYPGPSRRIAHWARQFVLGTVARLESEKGIAYLLRAFGELLTMIPHARLIIVGDGSERHALEWLARKLAIERAVQWVGFQRNIPEWMKTFDCFVLPSSGRESFGIVLLEAMAAGCPVVASNLGGIPEIVLNNRTGVLVEPRDPELLMRAILYLYRHPDIAMELGVRGRERVEQHFSRTAMFDALAPLFL